MVKSTVLCILQTSTAMTQRHSEGALWLILKLCLILFGPLSGPKISVCQSLRQATYHYTDPESLLPYQPQRYIDPGYTGIRNKRICADLSLARTAIGFLYNDLTGLCTPVTGLATSGIGGARAVDFAEGSLYWNKRCPSGYELHGADDAIVCLRISLTLTTYEDAVDVCESWGGHLAMVKTEDKLFLVKSLAPTSKMWIGLDDNDIENVFVWKPDGTVMTSSERSSLFNPGEPSSSGTENCVIISTSTIGKLNDIPCSLPQGCACETVLYE